MKIIFIFIFLNGCAINLESYPVVDRDYKKHSYSEKLVVSYESNEKILYCQEHYKWELIKRIYTNDGIKYIIKGDK